MKRSISYNFLRAHSCFRCLFSSQPVRNIRAEPIPLKYYDLLKDITGSSPETLIRALTMNMDLQTLDEKSVVSNINLFKEIKFSNMDPMEIIPFLKKHPGRLKNRYQCLYEYGFIPHKVSAQLINRFFKLSKTSVLDLKELNLLEKDFNVLLNLWKVAGLKLEDCPTASDEASLHSLKAIAIKAYMKEKVGISDEIISQKEDAYLFRLLNKSFKTINMNYYIFKDIIGLSKTRIGKNWYILHMSPDNVMEMLNSIKKIGQMDVKDCLHVYPKIGLMTANNMEKIIQYTRDAGIPDTALRGCLKIFTLNCETVNKRLQELEKNEFFLFNRRSPRILEFIHYQTKAKKRMEIMEQLKLNATLCDLLMDSKNFERACLAGNCPSGADCLHYLRGELNMENRKLSEILKRHPRWTFVPLVDVGKNLQRLRKSFSDEEIKKNVYCLFYSSEKLNTELENLDSREELEYLKENGAVKNEYILPLLLYFLEKESNFTGESVWSEETNPYQDIPDPLELLKTFES